MKREAHRRRRQGTRQSSIESPRKARAEKRQLQRDLLESRTRIQELERQLNVLTNTDQYVSLEDRGRSLHQDEWNTDNCSRALFFPSPASCMCASVEADFSLASMPGVHGRIPMTSGVYSQPILVRGVGYTLLGLVGNAQQKEALKTCNNWCLLPMMCRGGYSNEEQTFTLEVDMINRTAKMYAPPRSCGEAVDLTSANSRELEVIASWDDLPPSVWVAVGMKRLSQREAVLLPRTHWDMQEISSR
eukprot:CAMPEP_0202510620 /NCGR_PEP_ID=MMETSP1361-20130828/53391_1 /ASSEMBLY_ACC=CAM_ASM_000849 /TAXON_ID=210615 /ORGANISM="Staurosira complex sp., Strain CCMP2646" /LENGTH=245 /DNA_ID=CAMNT_0049144893 /DNA_START=40 /DNA_END=777 /DNA_ORIENTATION=+